MFEYTTAAVATLKDFLTSDRLASYRFFAHPSDDDRAAIDLYVWNTDLCASFYAPIQTVEVALRNALHREFSVIFRRLDWYSDHHFKGTAANLAGSLSEVASRLVRSGKTVDPRHIVAGLPFGFWTQLVSPGPNGNYTRSFWNAGLHKAFPRYPGGAREAQRRIRGELLALKDFRNRVAHHEPIHNKKPERQYERILRVAGWIDEILPSWVVSRPTCANTLSSRPYSPSKQL